MRYELLNADDATPVPQGNSPIPLLVGVISTRYPTTKCLARGSQRKLMNAAAFSVRLGIPINTLTTINAEHMQRIGSDGVFGLGNLWDGFRDLTELMRKWAQGRDIPWTAIWSREVTRGRAEQPGEHWHIGHHLPHQHQAAFLAQLANWTGEGLGHDLSGRGTIGRSEFRGWHVKCTVRNGKSPEQIAAYLGKAEPNKISKYRKTVPNPDKVEINYGGEGLVEGRRMGIAHSLSPPKQLKEGFVGPHHGLGRRLAQEARQRPAYRPLTSNEK